MLILKSEDIKLCFMKDSTSNLFMGIKYENWYFYFSNFLDLDLKTVQQKYSSWDEQVEKDGKLTALLEKDNGIYFCIGLEPIEIIPTSQAIYLVQLKMRNCPLLQTQLYHRSWQISKPSFVGKKACDWLTKQFKISRFEAKNLGQKCLEKELFINLSQQDTFEDREQCFYFFSQTNFSQGSSNLEPIQEHLQFVN